MAKQFYLPSTDEGRATWLNNLAVKLSNHSATLGISDAIVMSVQNDANHTDSIDLTDLIKRFKSDQIR